MTGARRLRTWTRRAIATIAITVLFLLFLVAAVLLALQTPWAKDKIRALIVRQANQYLTATLAVGHLEGSLFSDVTLRDVRLAQGDRQLVAIDTVTIAYNIREIWSRGVVIDRIRLASPRITATKRTDGRWDLAALVRKQAQEQERKGPARPLHFGAIQIDDGTIVLNTPVAFGAVHIPSRYEHLTTHLSFDYAPVRWTLRFTSMSWRGTDPDLTIESLTGALGTGPHGFEFDRLAIRTPTSAFTVSGTIHNDRKPTGIDLDVHTERFAFQEWGGIVRGLRNIAVNAAFDVALRGSVTAMATDLRMKSSAGTINGKLTLNTSVPGWRGRGAVDLTRLDLAGWLNRRDRPSNITGHVVFDLALRLGEGFPRGRYEFRGPHAGFMEYAADNVEARGDINATEVIVREATARAYGADVTASGTIAINDPYGFRFAGTIAGLDLRRVPKSVPVPHVESTLAFDYDVRGQFANPFIDGRARLATSTFLGATIADGTVGSIDTAVRPMAYSGDGAIADVDLATFGEGLDIAMLRDPRYSGRVTGRFKLDAAGTNAAELDLHASGRLARADIFNGTLSDAAVSLDIANGTLAASYDGRFDGLNPAIPFADPRYDAVLKGSGRVKTTVRDLMLRTPSAADYDIEGDLTFEHSAIRRVEIDRGSFAGAFRDSLVKIDSLEATGPAITMRGNGTLAFTDVGASDFQYTVARADLARVGTLGGYRLGGQLTTSGRLTGPWTTPHLAGNASAVDFAAPGVYALSTTGDYDFDVPSGDPISTDARLAAKATFIKIAGQDLQRAEGTLSLARRVATFNITAAQTPARSGTFDGAVQIADDARSATIERLTVDFGGPWELERLAAAPRVAWADEGVVVDSVAFVGGVERTERLAIGGSWRPRGGGALRVAATNLHLESFQGGNRPPRYAGLVNADAVLSGTRDTPIVTGTISISNGRVDRFAYEKVAGRVDYGDRIFTVDFRVDESPGVWAAATGRVPLALFKRSLPEAPIDVRITSSAIQLGLLNGITSVVTNVSGEGLVNVHVIGTSRDPHFEGRADVSNAAFIAAATGVAYNNVRATFGLARDRITVESLHVEDTDHNTLDVQGSLATHELRVGDLAIGAKAHEFTVMRNELGRVAVNADLTLGGRFEAPVVEGTLSISSGALNVDAILERTLFRPYSTEETAITPTVDPLLALNPWDRFRLNLLLKVPDTLRLSGENVQVSPGTPIGISDVNVRVGGDLVLLKEPAQPLGVYGSFDQMSGTFAFQGRRFNVEQTSSINFRGGLSPEVYTTVTREISGVEARVTFSGPLDNPELHLASTPPLEPSDILALIVFNTSLNNLSAVEQQNLAVRAGTLAAGFLATPLVSALQGHLGLDVLEVSTSSDTAVGQVAPKVTVGEEIAPGLFARFSRQFGENEYNQVEIEYYLTRILQIRATFSDAATLSYRSPFRRIERGGIDLLLFFSF